MSSSCRRPLHGSRKVRRCPVELDRCQCPGYLIVGIFSVLGPRLLQRDNGVGDKPGGRYGKPHGCASECRLRRPVALFETVQPSVEGVYVRNRVATASLIFAKVPTVETNR